jgi:hypothetical protein
MKPEDLKILEEIHKEFYSNEFAFPDFTKHFLGCFTAYDDENRIISAGGIQLIPEVVLITDKRQSVRTRREALLNILQASMFIADKFQYNQIHVFIQEHGYEEQLKKNGFRNTKGTSLVLNF